MSQNADYAVLWELIKDIRFCMFVQSHPQTSALHSHPMTTQNQNLDEGVLYFFAPKDGEIIKHIGEDSRVNLAYANPDKDCYVSISGNARLSDDQAKKAELFNAFAKAWFPGGAADSNLGLVTVPVEGAEFWNTKENKMIQLFKIMKANWTGAPPVDLGEHGKINPPPT